jgi:hypothetical protein
MTHREDHISKTDQMQAILALPRSSWFPVPPGAYPTGLASEVFEQLDERAANRLRQIEQELAEHAPTAPALRASSNEQLFSRAMDALMVAEDYYIESGTIIWRALDHDYQRLLNLSANSTEVVEREFLEHATHLKPLTFIDAVASLRVLAKVGEWVILSEKKKTDNKRELPVEFLLHFMMATFLTSCLLDHIRKTVRGAKPRNLRTLAKFLMEIACSAYRMALDQSLPQAVGEENHWYWSPNWQEGEAEADLDRLRGRIDRFGSAEHLIQSLKRS